MQANTLHTLLAAEICSQTDIEGLITTDELKHFCM